MSSRWTRAFAALVVASSLASTAGWGWAAWTRPSAADWDAAERAVRAGWREGDAITVVPGWAERARERFGDLEFLTLKDPERELTAAALAGHARLWVVAPFGGAAIARGPLAARFGAPAQWLKPGRVQLVRFDPPDARRVSFDFGARLAEAQVHVEETKDAQRPCTQTDAPDGPDTGKHSAWRCGPDDWKVVRRRTLRVGGGPLECIWLHPHDPGTTVVAEWKDVQGARIAGEAGIQWRATWAEKDANPRGDALLRVDIDGAPAAQLRIPFGDGRVPLDVPLPPGAHRVALRSSAENNVFRMLCVRAVALGEPW